ncbi:MORN repeat/FYVE zinc finger containing protein [Novymonas esmeraldas]|uniref:MORN repeat/FYVE zinc finger containing protein n=1 Tax=Novymonas esmeraldas TaxID=1808958 RepID=A0AAW0EK06_9TRYP
MAGRVVSSAGAPPATPQYYDHSAALTRPVTTIQVVGFTPREGMAPSLVLAGGSHYYGPVTEVDGCRVPSGCGIILFHYDEKKEPTGGGAADGGGLTSYFFSRGVPQGDSAAKSMNRLRVLCKQYQSGDRYGGDWVDGVFHGDGVLVTSTFTYQGTWREGLMQGRGTISYTRKYVDHQPRSTSGGDGSGGVAGGVSHLLLKGLSYVSPFDLVATAPAPKEYIGDFDAQHYRHGVGLMRYFNGDVYEGEWRDNCRHGRGTLRRPDGEVYDGDWAVDQRHGHGKILFHNGSLFKGCMEHDQRSGEGIMRFANGDEYFGHFVKDCIDGHGTMRYRNGDVYEGAWRDHLRHGRGRYTLKRTGATMHGEFLSGLIHGEGTVVVPGVSTFVGAFVRGERTIGTMHWHLPQQSSEPAGIDAAVAAAAAAPCEDGGGGDATSTDATLPAEPATTASPPPSSPGAATVVPVVVAGKANSRGLRCYQGEWHGEHMHGRGLLWYANGDFFAGCFHKSHRHGAGNMRYAAEDAEFSGHYVRDIRHGLGLLQRADGSIRAGRWHQNIFVEGYEGEWNGVAFDGIGRLTMPVDTFLAMRASNSTLKTAELRAMLSDGVATAATASRVRGDEEGRSTATEGAAGDAVGDSAVRRAALSPLFIDFFGIFRNGLRDGLGVLKLPALDGLVGSALNLAEERKSSSSGGGGGGGGSSSGGPGSGGSGDARSGATAAPSMILKGRWVREVLHCNKGVWAFPNGVVYVGRFSNGARDADRARVWWPDGSVLECGWRNDAPSGAGVWHQRSRVDPVFHTVATSVRRRSRSQRAPDPVASQSAKEGVAEEANCAGAAAGSGGGDLLGLSYLWGLIGTGLFLGGGGGSSSSGGDGDDDGKDDHEADAGRPRRVLVDFSNHFTFSCSWCPYSMDRNTYAAVVLPQVGSQTAPLSNGVPWPQLLHSPSMAATAPPSPSPSSPPAAAAAAAASTAAAAAGAVPWPVPTARLMSACATSLNLADAPATFAVGRATGAGVVYFDSGVVLAGEWIGNVPRLATPYRPWSAFDQFVTWQTSRAASRNCADTVPCPTAPRLQSCYAHALASAPDGVRGEPHRVSGGRLTVASSPLAFGTAAGESAAASVTGSSPPPPGPDARCTLCGKDYSFFRKRSHCTLCLRSTCASCLGHMDAEGAAHQEDVKALLRHAYRTAERAVQLTAAAAAKSALVNNTHNGGAAPAARQIVFPSIPAEQVDNTFDKKSGTTVPVCADCVRAMLWKLRYTQLWIPTSMLASVVDGDRRHRHQQQRTTQRGGGDEDSDEAGGGDGTNPRDAGAYTRESPRQVSATQESLPPSRDRSATPVGAVHDATVPGDGPAPDGAASPEGGDDSQRSADTAAAAAAAGTAAETTPGDAGGDVAAQRTPTAEEEEEEEDATATVEQDETPTTPVAAAAAAAAAASSPGASPVPSASAAGPSPRRHRSAAVEVLPSTQYITYSGYTSHSIPHVYGELWWGRRYYYRGGFSAGERHGFGVQYMPNGERYEGAFEHDAWHGEGVYYLEDGSVLLGEFHKGKLYAVHYRGEVEESETVGVRPHGRGIGYSADGSVYNGEWVRGHRHGTGMLQLADGSSVYSGTFVSDAMEGMGKLVTTSGAYYGDFNQNQQNGKGLLFTATCVVEGSWVQGTSCGFTRLYERATGEVYETTYRDGNERDDCFTAPVVVEDSVAAECGQCATVFSFFVRRHHCRLCGDVFCDACTQHRATLPATVTGDSSPGAAERGNPGGPTASAASGPQLRVCDACFLRLTQRRTIALRRYTDGSVYAGCWSQGRWVSRGLYCRPDGVFIVMDTLGHPLLPPAETVATPGQASDGASDAAKAKAALPVGGLGVNRRPPRAAAGLPVSSSILQDAAPAKELLDNAQESSPRKELDAFLLWWATTRSRCGLHVPLDVALVSHYQQLPAQLLRDKEATVKVGSDAAMHLAAPARCTVDTPHTPSLAPIHLFVSLADSCRAMQAMVEGEVTRESPTATAAAATASTGSGTPRVTTEERRTIDGDVEAAAMRASRFMAVVLPRAPAVPITAATTPVTSSMAPSDHPSGPHPAQRVSCADPAYALGVSAWATRPPPLIEAEDISDEALVEMIRTERSSWTSPSRVPLMPPTPTPPPSGANNAIAWDAWSTREVPRYLPPPLTAVSSTTPAERTASAGDDDSVTANPPLPPRSEADMYFACPLWGPTVPDVQKLVEQGKMTQAAQLMRRLQRQHTVTASQKKQQQQQPSRGEQVGDSSSCSDDDDGDRVWAKDERSGVSGTSSATTNAAGTSNEVARLLSCEQRAQAGVGWAPAPMRGPFTFDISTHERRRSADGLSWRAAVSQREVQTP